MHINTKMRAINLIRFHQPFRTPFSLNGQIRAIQLTHQRHYWLISLLADGRSLNEQLVVMREAVGDEPESLTVSSCRDVTNAPESALISWVVQLDRQLKSASSLELADQYLRQVARLIGELTLTGAQVLQDRLLTKQRPDLTSLAMNNKSPGLQAVIAASPMLRARRHPVIPVVWYPVAGGLCH